MHYNWAEVAPAAPALIEAIPPLLLLAGLLFALGCVLLIHYFIQALFGALRAVTSWIPLIGGITQGAINSAEQTISNALGRGISRLESSIGHQFHNLARVLSHLWNTLVQAAELIFALTVLAGAAVTLPVIHALERPILRAISTLRHLLRTTTSDIHSLEHRFTATIAHGVYPRLRTLEHDVTVTLPRAIRNARALAREAEAGVARLWDAVRGIEARVSDAAIAATIATALAAIGLDWLSCKNGASRVGRAGCALWDDLGSLLSLFVDTFLLTNICELLPIFETAVSDIAEPIVVGLTDVGAGLCSGGIGAAPSLQVPNLSLPANPGVTLNLP